MATIREQTIVWMIDHGPGQFTVTRLADDLGLTRRQALNALHGLANSGLRTQLTRGPSGTWVYDPPDVIRRQDGFPEYVYDDGRKPTVMFPMGFEGKFKVVARAGNVYLVRGVMEEKLVDVYAWLEPIDGPIERLAEHEEQSMVAGG